MSDKAKISIQDAFITVNFGDLERFNDWFGLDEIIFFQYLVFKCSSNTGEWWQSMTNIQTKLKIKKDRLKTIVNRFEGLGILTKETKGFRNNTHYTLLFSGIAKPGILKLLYNWEELSQDQQKSITIFYETLAKRQLVNFKSNDRSTIDTKDSDEEAYGLLMVLSNTFRAKRRQHNRSVGKEELMEYAEATKPKHAQLMQAALAFFDQYQGHADEAAQHYIKDAYLVYCDEINNIALGKSINNQVLLELPKRDHFAYFLSAKNDFAVITAFHTVYAGYSRKK